MKTIKNCHVIPLQATISYVYHVGSKGFNTLKDAIIESHKTNTPIMKGKKNLGYGYERRM